MANVRSRPDREAPRIGYLRAGALLMARTAEPVGDAGCRGGWYELTTGGFACNRRDVIAFYGERLPAVRGAQPNLEAKLPYQYGYARRDNTAVYRRLPTDKEAAQFEGYRIPGTAPAPAPEGASGGSTPDKERTPAGPVGEPAEPRPPVQALEDGPAAAPSPAAVVALAASASEAEAETPADAGAPTLGSLMATPDEEGNQTVLLRRMMAGFYVSLDRDFRAGRRRYWRTQQNEYIPYAALSLKDGTDFRGVVLDGEDWQLPLGYVLSSRTHAYTRRDTRRVRRTDRPGYHHVFRIFGEEEIGGSAYYAAGDQSIFRTRDVTRVAVRERPAEAEGEEKWIDVDLTHQTLVAYEGDRPVFATLVSTGQIQEPGVPDLDHATPPGVYRIKSKHLATTMDGDNAFDGPYSIQDVPYVMYYELGYALHSAFWHNVFGRPKSHGCVNLSPQDARWIFDWTAPHLPAGWHGVYPTEEEPGTLLLIHGETPLRGRSRPR